MATRTRQPRWRDAGGVGISQTLLIACAPFGPRLTAPSAARAIAIGAQEGGLAEPDVCPVPEHGRVTMALEELDFDTRLRRARAVVVGGEELTSGTLAASVLREIATRARQGGVPAYAVTSERELGAFDARVLDLQVVLRARTRAALIAAGRELALLV